MEKKFTKGKWSYSPQRGEMGHCFAAQVWANGVSLAHLDSTEDEKEASHTALLMSKAPELLDMLSDCIGLLELLEPPKSMVPTYGNLMMNAEQLLIDATTI